MWVLQVQKHQENIKTCLPFQCNAKNLWELFNKLSLKCLNLHTTRQTRINLIIKRFWGGRSQDFFLEKFRNSSLQTVDRFGRNFYFQITEMVEDSWNSLTVFTSSWKGWMQLVLDNKSLQYQCTNKCHKRFHTLNPEVSAKDLIHRCGFPATKIQPWRKQRLIS